MLAKSVKRINHLEILGATYQIRCFTAKAVQDPLPYPLNGLEPVLSEKLMDLHYNKHHHNYVMKYNERIELIQDAIS